MIQFVSDLEHSTNTTDRHNIIEILLKVAFSKQQPTLFFTTTYSLLMSPFKTDHRVCSKSNATGKKRFTLPEHRGLPASVLFFFFLAFLCCVAYFLFVCMFVCFCLFFCGGRRVALFVVFLYLLCSMLPVALGCSFVNTFSVFSKRNFVIEIHSRRSWSQDISTHLYNRKKPIYVV